MDVESLWVEVEKGQGMSKILMGVCYRPPKSTEEMDIKLIRL